MVVSTDMNSMFGYGSHKRINNGTGNSINMNEKPMMTPGCDTQASQVGRSTILNDATTMTIFNTLTTAARMAWKHSVRHTGVPHASQRVNGGT